MVIKQVDDRSEELVHLELVAKSGRVDVARRAARDPSIRKAGIRGESESGSPIDFYFAASPNWTVIHDLRVEHNDRVAGFAVPMNQPEPR